MAKRVIQHATSASRRTRRVEKPSTPWRRHLATEVPEEIKKANPAMTFKWVWKGNSGPGGESTRVTVKRQEGYVDVKVPKGADTHSNSVTGHVERKDAKLMALSQDRKAARDYYVQERAEAHLKDTRDGA